MPTTQATVRAARASAAEPNPDTVSVLLDLVRPREPKVLPNMLGPYHLIRSLGAGGMGRVFLAEHRAMRRPAGSVWVRVPTCRAVPLAQSCHCASIQRRAAPMPRVSLFTSEAVWRVPKPARRVTVSRSGAGLMVAVSIKGKADRD